MTRCSACGKKAGTHGDPRWRNVLFCMDCKEPSHLRLVGDDLPPSDYEENAE